MLVTIECASDLFVDDDGAAVLLEGATCGEVNCTGVDCFVGGNCVQGDRGGACVGLGPLLDGDDANDDFAASLLCAGGDSCQVDSDGSERCVPALGAACTEPGDASCIGNVLRVCGFNEDLLFGAAFGIDCGAFGDDFVCTDTIDGADCVSTADDNARVGGLDVGDSTYNRPFESCLTRGDAARYFFETWQVRNTSSTTATVTVNTSDVDDAQGCSFDSVIYVHNAPFNPASPGPSCDEGNDDITPDAQLCSELTFTVAANTTRVVVVTSFDPRDTFDYQLNITAPSTVTVTR